jgi:hypothetical protein
VTTLHTIVGSRLRRSTSDRLQPEFPIGVMLWRLRRASTRENRATGIRPRSRAVVDSAGFCAHLPTTRRVRLGTLPSLRGGRECSPDRPVRRATPTQVLTRATMKEL